MAYVMVGNELCVYYTLNRGRRLQGVKDVGHLATRENHLMHDLFHFMGFR